LQKLSVRMSAFVTSLGLASSLVIGGSARAADSQPMTGTLNGATYIIEVPPKWNGTLLLYNHGTVGVGAPNPASDRPSDAAANWLLDAGYALAGSSWSTTGYALSEAVPENLALLDYFASAVGKPKRTVVWGTSQGGMITADMLQKAPDRFDGGLAFCGFLAGAVAQENIHLDSAYVIKTLLPGGADVPIVNIPDGAAAVAQAQQVIADAQNTPEGRARLALAAAVGDVSTWYDANTPQPASDDYVGQEANQFSWFKGTDLDYYLNQRVDMEHRAGGNFSWNVGIDYAEQLERSTSRDEVYALYKEAGLSLSDDLQTLARSPRIEADPSAVKYLVDNVVFDGKLQDPLVAMHTTGDGRRVVQEEAAFADSVRLAGQSEMLRQPFVNRAGHCEFTPGEELSALMMLMHRLDTGQWAGSDAAALNAEAASLGSGVNTLSPGPYFSAPSPQPVAPAFADFQPAPFLRPWDARCISGNPVGTLVGELGPKCL
jgi:pimeloyl-ACP methyl ester carboxylesterase